MTGSSLKSIIEKATTRANSENKVHHVVIDSRKQYAITTLNPHSLEWRKKKLEWIKTLLPNRSL